MHSSQCNIFNILYYLNPKHGTDLSQQIPCYIMIMFISFSETLWFIDEKIIYLSDVLPWNLLSCMEVRELGNTHFSTRRCNIFNIIWIQNKEFVYRIKYHFMCEPMQYNCLERYSSLTRKLISTRLWTIVFFFKRRMIWGFWLWNHMSSMETREWLNARLLLSVIYSILSESKTWNYCYITTKSEWTHEIPFSGTLWFID